jgi:hypothetical protein
MVWAVQHDGFALAGGQGPECGQDLAVGLADQGALLGGDHVVGAGQKTQGSVAAGQAAVRGAAAVEDAVPEVTEGLVLVLQRLRSRPTYQLPTTRTTSATL